MQVVDLCQILRDEESLRTIGEKIGHVISIDTSEAYKAKLFGPHIRLLIRDSDRLPHTIVIPRLDGEGKAEYKLEFSGLPNQCGRCRSREHQVRHCPKREMSRRHNRTREPPIQRAQEQSNQPESTPTQQTKPQQIGQASTIAEEVPALAPPVTSSTR